MKQCEEFSIFDLDIAATTHKTQKNLFLSLTKKNISIQSKVRTLTMVIKLNN